MFKKIQKLRVLSAPGDLLKFVYLDPIGILSVRLTFIRWK